MEGVAVVGGGVATDGDDEFPLLFGIVVVDWDGVRLGGPFLMVSGHAEDFALSGGGIIDRLHPAAFAMEIEADDGEDIPRIQCFAFARFWNVGGCADKRVDALLEVDGVVAERAAFTPLSRVFCQFHEFIGQFHDVVQIKIRVFTKEAFRTAHLLCVHDLHEIEREAFTADTFRENRIVLYRLFRNGIELYGLQDLLGREPAIDVGVVAAEVVLGLLDGVAEEVDVLQKRLAGGAVVLIR